MTNDDVVVVLCTFITKAIPFCKRKNDKKQTGCRRFNCRLLKCLISKKKALFNNRTENNGLVFAIFFLSVCCFCPLCLLSI